MPEYELYCFAQSGNAYRAALMLNLIGADWKPVFVDFFKGETRTPEYRGGINEMGEAPVLAHGEKKLTPVGRDPHLSGEALRQISSEGEDQELEALRWIIFDNQKVNGFLGPYRFLKNWAKPAGDPAVLAFFKGRIDGNLGIINKRLERPPFLLGDRPTIADVSLAGYLYYPAGGVRLRLGKDHPAIAAWRERMKALPGWAHPYELMPGHPLPRGSSLRRQPAIDGELGAGDEGGFVRQQIRRTCPRPRAACRSDAAGSTSPCGLRSPPDSARSSNSASGHRPFDEGRMHRIAAHLRA